MNKKIKEKWIAALRSGKYKQGTGRLRKIDNTFCCIGVLCDLYNKDLWSSPKENCDFYSFGQNNARSGAPKEVVDWAEEDYDKSGGLFYYGDKVSGKALFIDNDSNKKSFNEIADIIEKEL